MTALLVLPFPYREDSASLFARIRRRPWAVFLDSGRPGCTQGRYDVLAWGPERTLTTLGTVTRIQGPRGSRESRADPLDLLAEALGPRCDGDPRLPFSGGAIGAFGYDLAWRLETLPSRHRHDQEPLMAVGVYPSALVVDHIRRRSFLVNARGDARALERFARAFGASSPDPVPFACLGTVRSTLEWPAYLDAFARVQAYIRAGDCYQVNLARRFEGCAAGDPWSLYAALRGVNPVPFGAYLELPGWRVLSASPERFLHIRGDRVETRPIKGTRPRDPDPERDRALAEALLTSPKDRAENLMIVDLLRNDLGRACRIGSVRVPELFRLEGFPRVHHLVSRITGRLEPGKGAPDLLRGAFPGGSVTGAPKIRAMEVIEELETHARGFYCGAIGYLGFDGSMDTNIAIRTLVMTGRRFHFWSGGGIVADSRARQEFEETLHKAAPFLDLLQRGRRV